MEPPELLLNYEELNFNTSTIDDAWWRENVRIDATVKLVGEEMDEKKEKILL